MADIKGIVLHKILNKDEGYLDAWSKLKLGYFGTEYSSIHKLLSKFYIKHQDLPSFEDLELHSRNSIINVALEALKLIEIPEVELDLAVEALLNEYTQELVLTELDVFIDNITMLDASEIKEELGKLLLGIEEKTLSSEEIVLMNDIELTIDKEDLDLMPLGFNNTFDSQVGGMAPTELLLIGGAVGSGKSNTCTNLAINQYEIGNTVPYFTIEMRAKEIFNRQIALLSGVDLGHISRASLSDMELKKIARVRTDMFVDAEILYEEFLEHNDYTKFEKVLLHTKDLKPDNQLIIVDNQKLTLANIDLTIQKFKAQFGDKMKLVVIDYLNQIDVENKYDWKVQIEISAKLKEFARKYNVILAAPYQIDKTGETRFSKGILDAADIAMTLEKSEGRIDFTSVKSRNMKKFEMASAFDESTMRIDPNECNLPPKQGEEEETSEDKIDGKKEDLPW